MRILMLGWEFPPFIAGGLGTACYGLTKALDALGHDITFVLPKAVDRSHSSHVRLLSPEEVTASDLVRAAPVLRQFRETGEVAPGAASADAGAGIEFQSEEFRNVIFRAVPSGIASPYGAGAGLTEEQIQELIRSGQYVARRDTQSSPAAGLGEAARQGGGASDPTPGFLGLNRPPSAGEYGGDLIGDVRRYAELCVMLTRAERYDVIHAHDWLTYPAGMAIARLTGIPLVVHVHSTEFDRSGENINRQLYEIERRGMHSAMRVITVSFWTRNIVMHRYNVSAGKIRVVWNGIGRAPESGSSAPARIRATDKIVLFLGRITMQKGPEYFIAAARRVLEKIDDVKFVVAGSGDMATRMIELAAQMGIGQKVLFTGFLRGNDVARAFKMADCYVMPSVSEPFGIAPLEAMSHDVPVIISKQSGVSEALTHVLKVDFWDVDEMANKIIAVLRHPPLRNTLRRNGAMELRHLTWEGAARKCVEVYDEAIEAMDRLAVPN